MNINKRIFYLVFEIVSIIIFIIGTNLLWNTFDIENHAKIAYAYESYGNTLDLEVENKIALLMPAEDNQDDNLVVKINNDSTTKKQYTLYLKINNNSTLNKNYLKIAFDGHCYYLKDLENFTKGSMTYYKLSTNNIKAKKEVQKAYALYLSAETPNIEQGKSLNFEFAIEEM